MSYTRHNDTGTRLYSIWKSVKCRCNNSNHPTYKYYGGRGITFYKQWNDSYVCFKEWALANGYQDDLELERLDVNDNYTPTNCAWITHHEQTMNRRDTLYITVGDKTEKLRDFCKSHRISVNTVNNWRHLNILDEKLSAMLGGNVIVSGGKKAT